MIRLLVNGRQHDLSADPETPLLYVLRNDLGLAGTKFGCGLGQCGACTVLIAGQAIRSCVTPLSAIAGQEVTTI
jgi:aerobic-type carbon monoxide dehydrogenase small subunit (CoxS/CutS family)